LTISASASSGVSSLNSKTGSLIINGGSGISIDNSLQNTITLSNTYTSFPGLVSNYSWAGQHTFSNLLNSFTGNGANLSNLNGNNIQDETVNGSKLENQTIVGAKISTNLGWERNSSGNLLTISNTGTGNGISVTSSGNTAYAIYGNAGNSGTGIYGNSINGPAIKGASWSGYAGYFETTNPNNNSDILSAKTISSNGYAISGHNISGVHAPYLLGALGTMWEGVYGSNGSSNTNGYAGLFNGRVKINGNLEKSAGSFRIDHPLDPANKYLLHSFVESPDMKNIYDGVVTLDMNGESFVELPNYFEALNKDFRYQLTSIGSYSQVYISQEIENNKFKISGGKPGQKISWQVTGTRKDAYAEKYRIQVEEQKVTEEKGRYLHPEVFGLPKEMGIDYDRMKKRESNNK